MIHTVLADFNIDNSVAKLNFTPSEGFEIDLDAFFFDVRYHNNDYGFTNTMQNSSLAVYLQNKELMNGFNFINIDEHKAVLSKMTNEEYKYSKMTDAEKQAYDSKKYFDGLRAERMNLKSVLSNTDWIVSKIAETQALGDSVDELKSKYAEQLNARKSARSRINEIEKELTDANESFEIVFE